MNRDEARRFTRADYLRPGVGLVREKVRMAAFPAPTELSGISHGAWRFRPRLLAMEPQVLLTWADLGAR